MIARSHIYYIKLLTVFLFVWLHIFDVVSRTLLLYTRLSQSWNVDETPNPSLCITTMVDAWSACYLGFKSPMGSNFFCILSSRL